MRQSILRFKINNILELLSLNTYFQPVNVFLIFVYIDLNTRSMGKHITFYHFIYLNNLLSVSMYMEHI